MKICPKCGWENDDDFNFCLGCGSQLPANSAYPTSKSDKPASSGQGRPISVAPSGNDKAKEDWWESDNSPNKPQATLAASPIAQSSSTPKSGDGSSPARLVLLLPNGQEGGTYPLKPNKTLIGRRQGNILFLDDPYVSPLHATFVSTPDGKLIVKDESSLNGLFIRLREQATINHKDVLLLGKQLLRFEEIDQTSSSSNGAPYWGSPYGPYWGRLVQMISGGSTGNSVLLGGTQVDLGRERGQITFPGDRFISAIHARLSNQSGSYMLEDLGSRNGTFVHIRNERVLKHNDILIIGEQLLRVELLT